MLYNIQKKTISADNLQRIAGTRGWVLTFAIFLFLYAAFFTLSLIGNLLNEPHPLAVILCLSQILFYIAAGVNACKFHSQIRIAATQLSSTALENALENALKHQAKTWLWLGICTIIYLILAIISAFYALVA